jgi:hypothetical protein
MILCSPAEHENAELRRAGMDGRHLGPQDASGHVHVNLDSCTPCWNDQRRILLKLTEIPPRRIFKGGRGEPSARDAMHPRILTYFCEPWRPFDLAGHASLMRNMPTVAWGSVRGEEIPSGDLFEQLNYLGIARDLFDHLFVIFG